MTTNNILRRNLVSILMPMLLSVLGLGVLTVVIIFRYINHDLQRTNANLLDSFKNNTELLFRVMDQYIINFSFNPMIITRAKAMVSSGNFGYVEQQNSLFINSIINTPVFTYPYLHSAYIYYYGYNRFLCSNLGLSELAGFYDHEWVQGLSVSLLPEDFMGFQYREVQPYVFEKGTGVFTLNQALYSPGVSRSDGIITLNFDANYILGMLQSLVIYDGQIFLAVDSRGRRVLSNAETLPMPVSLGDLAGIENTNNGALSLVANKRYRFYKTESSKYGLVFMSLVPLMSSYHLAANLIIMTLIAMIVVTVVGVAVAMATTQRNRKQLLEIVRIFTDFEKSGVFPTVNSQAGEASNVYDYIIHNILGIFLRNHQMKLQLRERKYQQDLYALKALQAQINPHFLYNVMETISWKTMELVGGYSIINKMIENLSGILKYCLSRAEDKVTLRDEIEYTKRYIALQNIRHDHEVHVQWIYQEENLDNRIIKLIFQPIIENAMKHGGLSYTRDVEIVIRIKQRDNHLSISIADNGVGMDFWQLMEVRASFSNKWQDDKHIGLINTNQRLRLLYGETCSIKIFSKKNKGTTIFFLVPVAADVNKCLPTSDN